MGKRKIVKNLLFYLMVLMVSLMIYRSGALYHQPRVLISNFLILVLSLLLMIFGDKYSYSMNKIFYLFVFFFFGIAPAIQYQEGIILWVDKFYSNQDYFMMNSLILFIMVMYHGLYTLFSHIKPHYIERKIVEFNNRSKKMLNVRLLVVALLSLLISLFVYRFNIDSMLIRGGSTIFTSEGMLSLIYFNFVRPIPAISLFFYKIKKNNNRYVEVMLWIILLLTNFPSSAARFYIAAIYIPLLLIYIKRMDERYLLLNKILIAGLLFVFPLLDQLRQLEHLSEFRLSAIDFKMFIDGHFDSYQMFMYVVINKVITHGRQLLTALLFFVPRSLWPGKSVGSGNYIANKFDFIFDNISMNFFGEGYINFGYFGIFLFVIVLAYFNARYDYLYWNRIERGTALSVFYLQGLGLQVFWLRGDLLSGFAFLMGMFVSTIVVYFMITKKHK